MSERAGTTAWARELVEGLVGAGLREACIAPGSRSTPLVMALARHDDVETIVHLDERSAAFHALGIGKRSRRPAAVVTTSGTAVANLLPAVVEASWSEAPLLLLTADRPLRLRGTDANQTIDQVRIFGDYPRLSVDAGPGHAASDAAGQAGREDKTDRAGQVEPAGEVGELAARAWAAAVGAPSDSVAGPVHLNLRFDKPLEPPRRGEPGSGEPAGDGSGADRADEVDGVAARAGAPGTSRVPGGPGDVAESVAGRLDRLADRLRSAGRVLLVCGPAPEPGRLGPAILRLARATGWPVAADPLSGARFTPGAREAVAGAADLFLRSPEVRARLRPDVILRLGPAPTSAALLEALTGWSEAHQVIVHGGRRWEDHLGVASERLRADAATACDALAGRLVERVDADAGTAGESEWRGAWSAAEAAAREAIEGELAGAFFEGTVAADLAAALPPDATLFAGSSMPIRDLDAFAAPRDETLHVVGNRGASGIDGSVSAALGAASVSAGPSAALIGDLAFLHDLNGLHAADATIDLVLVVVDNDGGGIFHMLPIREHEPEFTRYFATPHGLDLGRAADLHGLPFRDVDGRRALGEALSGALRAGGVRILRVRSDRESNRARHEEVERAVHRAVAGSSGSLVHPRG